MTVKQKTDGLKSQYFFLEFKNITPTAPILRDLYDRKPCFFK